MKYNLFISKASIQETAQLVDKTKKSVDSRFRIWKQEIHALKWLYCIYQSLPSKTKSNLGVDLQERNRNKYLNRCVKDGHPKWDLWQEDAQRRS